MAFWSKVACGVQVFLFICTWLSILPSGNSQDSFYMLTVKVQNYSQERSYDYAPARFGRKIYSSLQGAVVHAVPRNACSTLQPRGICDMSTESKCFVVIDDDDGSDTCDYGVKAYMAQQAGYHVAIIGNTKSDQLYEVESEIDQDLRIYTIYVGKSARENMIQCDGQLRCLVTIYGPRFLNLEAYIIPFAIIVGICFVLMAMFMISRYYRHYLEQRRNRISPANLRKIPTKKFKKGDNYYDVCAICLDEYKDGDRLRILPCQHAYHCKCVDPWLTEGKKTCPVCKQPVETSRGRRRQREDPESGTADQESDSMPDETTPLIASASASSNTVTA